VAGGSENSLPPNLEWGSILEFNLDGSGRQKAFGLPQRPMEDQSQGQGGYDGQVGVSALSSWTPVWRRIP